jgi:hypothetical protein
MDRRIKFISRAALAGALFAEPIAGGLTMGLAAQQPHTETAVIPNDGPATCVPISTSGTILAAPIEAFYAAMVPMYLKGRDSLPEFVVNFYGTPVRGNYFSVEKAMSLLGKFVPRCQLRAIRRALLAGKPQAVGGQRKSTGAVPKVAPTPPPVAPAPAGPTEQASAHEAVMHFMQGIKIAALPEGKKLLVDTQWIVGDADRGKNFYTRPDYTDMSTIFASLFDSDIPSVKGYKEVFDMKAVTQAGTTMNIKFLVIAFKDGTTGKWKVLDSTADESSMDIEQQVEYFKQHLADAIFSARENYAKYGHWLLLDGRLAEARSALTTAKTATTRSAYGDNRDDPVQDLQIDLLLTVIDKITSSPKTEQ